MKRIFIVSAMAVMTASWAAAAEPEAVDTLTMVEGVKSLIITNSGNTTGVEIRGTRKDPSYMYDLDVDVQSKSNKISDDWNLKLPFLTDQDANTTKKPRKKWKYTCMQHIYIGINMPQNAHAGFDSSLDCGIASMFGIAWQGARRGPKFSLGIGYGGWQLNLHHGTIWGKDGDRLLVQSAPEGAQKAKGRLYAFSFTMPLLVSQKLAGDFGVTAGAVVNFNTYTKAKSEYTLDGVTVKSKYKNLQQRILTADVIGMIGWVDDMNLYVRWSPMHMFAKEYGPQFKTLAVGLSINF